MPNHVSRILPVLLVAALLATVGALCLRAAQDDPPRPIEIRPIDSSETPTARDPWAVRDLGIGDDRGISLSIEPLTSGDPPDLLLARLQNQGPGDEVVLLGDMLDGGRAQDPTKLELEVTDRNGERITYRYAHPERMNVGGTLHPMVVPVLAQARYEMHLPLHHFFTHGPAFKRFVPPEGRFEINLRLQGAPPFQDETYLRGLFLWAGDVRSNTLVYGAGAEGDGSANADPTPKQ